MSQHIDDMQISVFRKCLVILAFVVLFCLDQTALPILFPASLDFSLTFASIFYIVLLTPFSVPFVLALFLGLIIDLISNGPFGLYALLYCLGLWVLRSQRIYLSTQTFIVIWLAYGLIVGVMHISTWLGYTLYYGGVFSLKIVVINSLFGFLAFPIIFSLYHIILRAFPAEEKDL